MSENSVVPVLTIDGPGGAGKGTISTRIAALQGWHYLDSGALYRILALAALRHQLALDDESALAALAPQLRIGFDTDGEIWLDGEAVSGLIRGEDCGAAASRVATSEAVRAALLARQRAFCRPPGLVADGRDMGTVVFPDATLKIFLTASVEERAQRRQRQLMEMGKDVNLADLLAEIRARDERDENRSVSPLKPAADAVLIDTTMLSIEGVVREVLALLGSKLN